MIYQLGSYRPQIGPDCYVDETALVIGRVELGQQTSIWCHAVLRGDNEPIIVGDFSNIQDGVVLHTDPGKPLTIGAHVSVGHMAMLHGCTIGDGALIGIKAVVLNDAVIGKNCLIGANTLVTEGKVIPEGSLVMGSPGKVIRALTAEEIAALRANAESYVAHGQWFARELRPL